MSNQENSLALYLTQLFIKHDVWWLQLLAKEALLLPVSELTRSALLDHIKTAKVEACVTQRSKPQVKCLKETIGLGCETCFVAQLCLTLIRWLEMDEAEAKLLCRNLCRHLNSKHCDLDISQLQNDSASFGLGSDHRKENLFRE